MSGFLQQSLQYDKSLTLKHRGHCTFVGVSKDLTLYAEVIYDDDDKLACYALRADGEVEILVDEGDEAKPEWSSSTFPADIVRRSSVQTSHELNFSIGRYRGMRDDERIGELVAPLTIQEKMSLVPLLKLSIMPPQLLGIAESVVLAEALLEPPNDFLVCRRLRFVYALAQPRVDQYHQKYDYDTVTLNLVHFYHFGAVDELSLLEIVTSSQSLLSGVVLNTPLDVLTHGDYVFVAEGGDDSHPCMVHIWTKKRMGL